MNPRVADSASFRVGEVDGLTLTLWEPTAETYMARLVGEGVDVAVPVFHLEGDRLDTFFAELARDWRGWEDERTWCSLESALALSVMIERAGKVVFVVELRDSPAFTWRMAAKLAVENGQLDALSRDAAAFSSLLRAAP